MSFTGLVPVLFQVEQRFNIKSALDWMAQYWTISIYCSLIYLALLYVGRRWMADRPAYNLRKPLILWNTGLAIFSFFGTINSVPNIMSNIYQHGISYTTCQSDCISDTHKHLAVWGWVFALSKIVEFGDTAFIVLRKTPLPFLHWYHHISVCVYTWYALTPSPTALSQWFGNMNYLVHTVMYSYYALRASGYKLHPYIPKSVTVLQLSQMFMGIYVNLLSWYMARTGNRCMFRYDLFYLAMAMYTSYAILFTNFFYQRYIKRKAPPKAPPKAPSKASPNAKPSQSPETVTASNHIFMSWNNQDNGGWKDGRHDNRVKSKQL